MGLMLDVTTTVGLEAIGREALLALYENLNAEIDYQNVAWADRDADFALRTGIETAVTVLEHVEPGNFHLGHIPVLIDAPIEKYPNVAVLAYDARPAPNGGIDQYGEEYACLFYVELMVKSVVSQEEVNRRVQRTAEAANSVILKNRTLNGIVSNVEFRSLTVADVFVRMEEKARGTRWYWQGARLDYNVRKPTASY